jgi:hypothetical protein
MGSGIAANRSHPCPWGRGWGMGSQFVANGHFLMYPEGA